MCNNEAEFLWIYTRRGVFRFCSRAEWNRIFSTIVATGWEMPSADEIGWMQSRLNPYPPGTFFTAADAESFSLAVKRYLREDAEAMDEEKKATLGELAVLFAGSPIFIWSEPPRKTAATGIVQIVYVYFCAKCGFLHHGSWLFDTNELSIEEIRISVENMLKCQYCPICGAKDIVSVPYFLPPFDPDRAPNFMASGDFRRGELQDSRCEQGGASICRRKVFE
jgi:hypothetical protein